VIDGLTSGRAAIRRLDITGSSSVLDAGDDTDNCATDFIAGNPAPRNNAGVVGTIPAATCGNGALEGLEQCDDGNLANGDGCSSTCMIQAIQTQRVPGDYNGDGRSDLFWRNTTTGGNVIWRSASSVTPQAVTGVTNQAWKVVGVGDFNGDGKADAFWRNTGTGSNVIWRSASSATQQPVTGVTNQAWKVAGIGDYDGDGKSDVFWRNTTTGSNVVWRSASSATQQAVTGVTNQAWDVVGIGDFNGDGKSDVFWRNTSTGGNVVWRSASAATQQAVTGVTSQAWKVVGIGDFDGDGKSDVFWRNTTTGSNAIWRSASSATKLAVTGVTSQDWQVLRIGDFNGDGESDVFWRNTSTGHNVIWLSASAATQLAVTSVASQAWSVVPYEGQALGAPPPPPPPPPPSVSLSIGDLSISEGNSGTKQAVFTVKLSQAAASAVTYDIATANGTATAGTDYEAKSLTGESIAAGTTSRSFAVSIIGDPYLEDNETFLVNVSHVVGATVADGQARGTILDEDYY
jgi:cysteine-rich repeat protein